MRILVFVCFDFVFDDWWCVLWILILCRFWLLFRCLLFEFDGLCLLFECWVLVAVGMQVNCLFRVWFCWVLRLLVGFYCLYIYCYWWMSLFVCFGVCFVVCLIVGWGFSFGLFCVAWIDVGCKLFAWFLFCFVVVYLFDGCFEFPFNCLFGYSFMLYCLFVWFAIVAQGMVGLIWITMFWMIV